MQPGKVRATELAIFFGALAVIVGLVLWALL